MTTIEVERYSNELFNNFVDIINNSINNEKVDKIIPKDVTKIIANMVFNTNIQRAAYIIQSAWFKYHNKKYPKNLCIRCADCKKWKHYKEIKHGYCIHPYLLIKHKKYVCKNNCPNSKECKPLINIYSNKIIERKRDSFEIHKCPECKTTFGFE